MARWRRPDSGAQGEGGGREEGKRGRRWGRFDCSTYLELGLSREAGRREQAAASKGGCGGDAVRPRRGRVVAERVRGAEGGAGGLL